MMNVSIVLIDENLDVHLAQDLQAMLGENWQVATVRGLGLLGVTNGFLLEAMAATGIDVLVTADQHLAAQQQHRIAALGLRVITIEHPHVVRAHASEIAAAIIRMH
jgi:hypothetical protein